MRYMVLVNPGGFGCVLVFPEGVSIPEGYICIVRGRSYKEAHELRQRVESGEEEVDLEEV